MKLFYLCLLTAFILFLISCGGVYEELGQYSNELAALDAADGFTNTENGLLADVNELNNQFKGTGEQVARSRTFNITISGDLNGFTWDNGQKAMVRTGTSLAVNTDYFTGTINTYTVTIKYYMLEAPSAGNEVNPSGQFNLIKSVVFRRQYDAVLTNKNTGAVKTYTVDLNLELAGVNDSGTPEDCIINGTRTAAVTSTNGSYIGTWTGTHAYTNVKATRTYDAIESKYYDQLEGSALITFSGTYTGPGGIDYTKNINADVTFNKTRTVTIVIDGNAVTLNIVTSTYFQ